MIIGLSVGSGLSKAKWGLGEVEWEILRIEAGLTTSKEHEGVLILRSPEAPTSIMVKVLDVVTTGCDSIWCVDCDPNNSW